MTIELGTYEVLRDRLLAHARTLEEKATALNKQRLALFGSTEMTVIANERIRTENNCVPRDIVSVGRFLLFGYNVFIGLKTETNVADVFSLHSLTETETGLGFHPLAAGAESDFLVDARFVKDFKELYRFYKDAKLLQLYITESKLLAVFQTGATLKDIKVLYWAVDLRGNVSYIDNRGERNHVYPPSHDFVWTPTTRENHVAGRFPHISILDKVFVETTGGDLTIKIENNTETGEGIYREPVEDPRQSLDDAEFHYAEVGSLILLKILPFRENNYRYFVFNTRTKKAESINAIGQACVQLPEDHGIIFPGGYYLQSGITKRFGESAGMEFKQMLRSPNGEDVLYVFHRRDEGRYILLAYNMIRREVQLPIDCHGYCIFDDGRMVIFKAVSDEPTRVHPMQIWQTPFMSDYHAAQQPTAGTYLEKVGNADLVRGISDAMNIRQMAAKQTPSMAVYEDIIAATTRMIDSYYWLEHAEVDNLLTTLKEIGAAADLVLDEFEKVQQLMQQAAKSVANAEAALQATVASLRHEEWTTIDNYVDALKSLREQRGHLISLRELRYADLPRIELLENTAIAEFDRISRLGVDFLQGERALRPYHEKLDKIAKDIDQISKVTEAALLRDALDGIGKSLDLLTEVVGSLQIEDPQQRTKILEDLADVLGGLNRTRALLDTKRKALLAREGTAQFGAEFKLFSQSVASALNLADAPEKCDAQLSGLLLRLEEIESRFSEFEEFLAQLAEKREEVYEAFNAKRQSLLEARQRRAQHMMQAAERILGGIMRRSATFQSVDELNAYFASDPMASKARELATQLRELGDSVKADEVDGRIKAARQEAGRMMRDRQDIYEEGAAVIRLGRHRFSVNIQPLDLTLLPRDGAMSLHLSGTDFFQPIDDAELNDDRAFWDQQLVSETPDVYRAEFLAASILADAEQGRNSLTLSALQAAALSHGDLLTMVQKYIESRYDEGYERGLHDSDAALILEKLLPIYTAAGLLRFAPAPRAAALMFWNYQSDAHARASWQCRAQSLANLRTTFADSAAITQLAQELAEAIAEFFTAYGIPLSVDDARMAGAYLFEEIARQPLQFIVSAEATALRNAFVKHLEDAGNWRAFSDHLAALQDDLKNRHALIMAWMQAFLDAVEDQQLIACGYALPEAAALMLTERQMERTETASLTSAKISGMFGQHPRIAGREMSLRLDEFLTRTERFRSNIAPAFRRYQKRRAGLLQRERERLRLSEYLPKPMSSFVRNRLINEVYLSLIGDNLAKQIGALGEGKRTDLMGMLLLISPPGYGKTTLMEYIASRLGLVFVKVNGPALGHSVTSLDAAEAPNATARQEVEKINFALEMGNNVMLYLDDIQHTNPELLQKFISLCDAQRKIEGIWQGKTRTYDLRGKRFCICMAGNPYTESGEKFQIPDMLANRADIYNLGDILSGREESFALSYIENALTSNPVLSPLTTREPEDIYKLIRMTQGEQISSDQLAFNYSAVELNEINAVLLKLFSVQKILIRVNKQYILSASQSDAYRTEPPFKLQGSYRNMNKLAAKIVPVMNDAELENLIDDHYLSEAQTLTTGAEHNLLKLAEMRGRLNDEQSRRWVEIKRGFARLQAMGGPEDDPATRVSGQIGLMSDRLESIREAVASLPLDNRAKFDLLPFEELLKSFLSAMEIALTSSNGRQEAAAPVVQPIVQPVIQPSAALDITPWMERLDETLRAISAKPRGLEVIQSLAPGVHDLMSEIVVKIEDSVLPIARAIGREINDPEQSSDNRLAQKFDRVIKDLDMLKDMLRELRKIDTWRRIVSESE